MRNKIKNILAACCALAAFAVYAGLQNDVTLVGGVPNSTNTVAAVSANTYHTGSFAINFARDAAFQLQVVTIPVQSGVVTYTLDSSLDNQNWQTNAYSVAGTTSSAATNNTFLFATNFSGVAFLRLGWVSNACATSYITNVTLKCFTKNGL